MLSEEQLIINLEERLYSNYSTKEWTMVVSYLVKKTQELFGEAVIFKEEDFKDINNGFCIEFSIRSAELSSMNLHIEGLLGADVLGEGKELRISSRAFIYSGVHKLQLPNGNNYFESEYVPDISGGQWKSLGWLDDEYDEF